MKRHMAGLAALALCLFVSTTLTARTEVTDKEIKEKIVGKWKEDVDEGGVKFKATLTYKEDGGYEAVGTLEGMGKTIDIKVTGKWKVEDGALVETYEKVEPAEFMEAGKTTKDKVLSIDDKTHTIRTEEGKEYKRTRIEK